MTRAQLNTSLLLWTAREKYRYRKWRGYVKYRPASDPLRSKWYKLYTEAHKMVLRRRRQLANQAIVSVDNKGLEFIMQEEGLILRPYNDAVGHATIGVGHLLHYGPVTPSDRAKYASFTRSDAMALLRKDLDRFEKAVRSVTKDSKVKITQRRFNALVSLAFNIGEVGFKDSSVARFLKAGDKARAADAFLLWAKPSVLLGRRKRERALFLG